MDTSEVDEWWLSSESDSDRSAWTLSQELEDCDKSVSDIFADSDVDNSKLEGSVRGPDNTNFQQASEIASDTEEMELHVESGDEPESVTVTLSGKNGRKIGSVNTSDPKTIEALKHKPLKVTPIFANPPPVDQHGNLYLGKHHRLKSGTGSLREIRKYQRSTQPLVPKAAFKRLIQEARSNLHLDCSFSKAAYEALQEACERYCVQIFNVANRIATHSKRVTLQPKDMQLALEILNKPWDVPGPSFTA